MKLGVGIFLAKPSYSHLQYNLKDFCKIWYKMYQRNAVEYFKASQNISVNYTLLECVNEVLSKFNKTYSLQVAGLIPGGVIGNFH
jgi:hypothetical protein